MKAMSLLAGATLASIGMLASPSGAAAQGCAGGACGPPSQDQSAQRTIEARVVDQSCYLVHGLQGPDHKKCAEVCAEQGVALVFLGDDGNIYLPVSMAMPSEGFNPELVQHAEEKVQVTGTVRNKAGTRTIKVDRIRRAG